MLLQAVSAQPMATTTAHTVGNLDLELTLLSPYKVLIQLSQSIMMVQERAPRWRHARDHGQYLQGRRYRQRN